MNSKILAALAAVSLAVGCSTHKSAYVPVTEPKDAAENTQTVVLLNKDLADALAVEGQQAKYSDDGRLEVFANFRNRVEKRLTVQVQTVFKDENGYTVGDDTAWETIIIPELSQHAYHNIAQNSKARKYTIRVRALR